MTSDLTWFKSSYSGSGGGECVEVALEWRKSTHSGTNGGDCVEVAACPQTVHVRDSKDPEGPVLTFPAAAWSAFLTFAAADGARG
ncbi:protein of unknown function [Actinacidiphila rubida]|uniref:DUF397 domain-containing protein n=2 Tax=Actinacidiphila rubida TaxID=310780 RepID=A0A1H8DG10_9ACTN|nr:DUF397 domain-containing protein [Actinacidiphila rubida]SEN06096.1 protein of unknown function [Actinacidiphila rubida]